MSIQKLPQGVEPNTISLVFGHPDETALPVEDVRLAADAVLCSSQGRLALQYNPIQGPPALIDYLIQKLARDEGLCLGPENVMIVAGSTHAVDMIGRIHAEPGAAALVEAPSYRDALNTLRDHRLSLHQIPIDEEGLIVEALDETLKHLTRIGKIPAFLYSIPNFQNPTGITITARRRSAILERAFSFGFTIVEDDIYRDLSFAGDVPPSFYAMAEGRNVLRIGSFSKILAPGLRLGWLIAEPDSIQRFANCGAAHMGGGANPFVAHIVSEFCRSGKLEIHIEKVRQLYRLRCDLTLAALERYMPAGVTWTRPGGGFFVWLTLPEGISVQPLQQAAQNRGVRFAPGTDFFVGGGGERNLRLAFSFVSRSCIEQGVLVLAQAIGEQ